ncbi:MAG: hypothetical protein R2752_03340 [Vicinamibacterales bacterium]
MTNIDVDAAPGRVARCGPAVAMNSRPVSSSVTLPLGWSMAEARSVASRAAAVGIGAVVDRHGTPIR